MNKNLILKILFFIELYVLVGSKIFAQVAGVASPTIVKVGVHTNPAVIHWKNPGIYFNPLYAKTYAWDTYTQDITSRRTEIYQAFSFGIKTESISTEIEHRKGKYLLNYHNIFVLGIKGVQELDKITQEQQVYIKSLEDRIIDLEAIVGQLVE